MFERVAIVGLGLIGASVALALDRAGAARQIVGLDRERTTVDRALQLGVIDAAARDEADAVRGSDLVLLAVPVGQTSSVLSALQPHLGLRGVVTDTGSTKCGVIEAARLALGGKFPQFVPAHPIAGKAASGVDAGDAALFRDARCVLTPVVDTAGHAVEAVREMWSACGARVSQMTPERHDAVFATVSHLPHLLSFAYMAALAADDDVAVKLAHAATGFRDFTRIAAASPELWRDVFIANRPALLASLDAFEAQLAQMRDWIERDEPAALAAAFETARALRSRWDP